MVVRGGVEPPTFRFSGAYAASLHVAGCGLMDDLAAETMARRRLVWAEVCRRWLPVWLPESTHGRRPPWGARSQPWEMIGTVQVAHHWHGDHRWLRRTPSSQKTISWVAPADETVRFEIGGTNYKGDLSTNNADAFRRQLAPYIEYARRAGRGRAAPGTDCGQPHGARTSGPGPKNKASRSANAGASSPASSSSTKQPREDGDVGLTHR